MIIEIPVEQLGNEGLEIRIPGFKGDIGGIVPAQVYIEVVAGKLEVHVWNGREDPIASVQIEPI